MRTLIGTTLLATMVAGVLFISSAPADPSCPQSSSGTTPPTPDQLGRPLNYVLVENCQAGAKQLESHFQVRTAFGQNDQPTNLAYAYSHDCSSPCESVAVAYQVVLVDETNSNQSPQNGALAINQSCDGCATFAYADQYAVDVAKGTTLTQSARHQLAQIAREVNQDIHADLAFADLDGRLRALAVQVKDIVDDGLQRQHVNERHRHDHQDENQVGQPNESGGGPGAATTTTTNSTTTSPTSSTTSSTSSTTATTSTTTSSPATTSSTGSTTSSTTS